ncbi:MAG: replication-associated recombination protein A [Acidobacteriota bacterium]|nr:MAG: replication-associated recombination protein A [Acidobacteriota bacterium]
MDNATLFGPGERQPDETPVNQPLADRIRPRTLAEVVGQKHLLEKGKFLYEAIRSDEIPSLILWGPPGVGKTTLAKIIAEESQSSFEAISAVLSGVKEVKKVIDQAKYDLKAFGRRTIMFVDEIHRFNKAQQDAFLPHVEDGTITLIGATTENPSFEVISPLLSRSRVLVLNALSDSDVIEILGRALASTDRGLGTWQIEVDEGVLEQIALYANGDARSALNSLEIAAQLARQLNREAPHLTVELVEQALQQKTLLYDKTGEEHYNLISALHKSLRNSDVDASLYWLGRMLEAGEDPMYVARRLVRFASEDVGLADPKALGFAVDAMRAFHFIGLPEGKLALAQITAYLAMVPKSNALYTAYGSVCADVEKTRSDPVPLALRNAPTRLMKDLGYSEGYRYAHQEEAGVADLECLPENLRGRCYYHPKQQGVEKAFKERLVELERLRKELRKSSSKKPEK